MERCERCEAVLVLCPPNFPFSPQYWICPDCDSTYCYEEEKEEEKSNKDT